MRYFSPSEFPEDPNKHAEPLLLNNLDSLRHSYGELIYPSPVEGALARFDSASSDSQHFAGNGSLSRAVDWFPGGSVQKAWLFAVSSGLFGGIGIYFDTHYQGRKWPMIHTDIRDRTPALLWYRMDGSYYYFQYNEQHRQQFFAHLKELEDGISY